MTREWFSASELAGLAGMPASHSAVVRRAKADSWKSRRRAGRGGGFEYHLSALPTETQASLLRQDAGISQPRPEVKETTGRAHQPGREELWARFEAAPQGMKDKAKTALDVLMAIERLRAHGTGKTVAIKQIGTAFGVSRATIYRYLDQVEGVERQDWLAALLPAYGNSRPAAKCSDEAWDFFKALYLTPEKRSIAMCHDLTAHAAEAHGWDWPSERTVTRWANDIPRTVRVLAREGENALLRLYPSQRRTVADLYAMHWINGDGYQHNVFVKLDPSDPNEKPFRPKTWFWQDIYSRRILGWRTDYSEHTDMIRLALGDVIARYGIPENATIDNTRAAANKWLTAGVKTRYRFKVKETDPLGVMPQLGIDVHWTSVIAGKGWGQAKPVERAFGVGGLGDYVDKHPRFSGAYTGPNPMEKPDNYGEKAVAWDVFVEVLAQQITHWNAKAKRRTEICAGVKSFDDAFNESYQRNADKIRRPTEAQQRLWLMEAESVLVQKDGAVQLAIAAGPNGKNRYGADFLIEHVGKRVVVRFDPDNLHDEIHVYQLDGRYLGAADCIHAAGFGDSTKGREWRKQLKRRTKAAKLATEAETRMTALEAAEYLPTPDDTPEPQTNVVRGAWPAQEKQVSGSDVTPDRQSVAAKYGFDQAMEAEFERFIREN